MSTRRFGLPSWLAYCLLAVVLFGCLVLFNRADDNSATLAPNLVFHR